MDLILISFLLTILVAIFFSLKGYVLSLLTSEIKSRAQFEEEGGITVTNYEHGQSLIEEYALQGEELVLKTDEKGHIKLIAKHLQDSDE